MRNLFLILLVFFSIGAIAQNKKNEKEKVPVSSNPHIAVKQNEVKKTSVAAESSVQDDNRIREKNKFPVDVKAGPAIFYVENDKPVDKPNWKKKKI